MSLSNLRSLSTISSLAIDLTEPELEGTPGAVAWQFAAQKLCRDIVDAEFQCRQQEMVHRWNESMTEATR